MDNKYWIFIVLPIRRFRRWLIELKLWCNESDYSKEQWTQMRWEYLRLGGDSEIWDLLIEERTLEQ